MANITREQLKEFLDSGNTNLKTWLGKVPDLTDLEIRGLDFDRERYNLGGRLRRVDFRGCRFREGEDWCVGHDFSYTDMRGANLEGVSLIGVKANDADWTGVNLDKANLSWGLFVDCILSDAKLKGAKFYQTDLNCSFLDGADFTGATFVRASVHATDLTGTDFSGIRARSTSFGGGKNLCFKNADLAGNFFTGEYLAGASFRGADLRGADLHSANLKGADFTGAIIDWRTNLDRAVVDDKTIWNVAKGGAVLKWKQRNFLQKWILEETKQNEFKEAQSRKAAVLKDLAYIYQDRE